jgi:NAD(P)-dependent dehydrogenase (short-subunit alcohol dehydrogenase family)
LDSFRINALGNVHLFAAFVPLIKKGALKKVIAISSGMGDTELVAEHAIDNAIGYAVSKAALNMIVAKFHAQYREEGILFVSISPGVVDTGRTCEHTHQFENSIRTDFLKTRRQSR